MPPGTGLSRAYILKECLLRRVRPWYPWNAVFGGGFYFILSLSLPFFPPSILSFFLSFLNEEKKERQKLG